MNETKSYQFLDSREIVPDINQQIDYFPKISEKFDLAKNKVGTEKRFNSLHIHFSLHSLVTLTNSQFWLCTHKSNHWDLQNFEYKYLQ